MISRLSLLLVIFALVIPLRAQNEPIKMTPEFPLTFPLDQHGKDVTVKYPVFLNPATILKPGMVLHVIYILSNASGSGAMDLVVAHHASMEQSYSRDTASTGEKSQLPPELAHEVEGYRRTVWEVPNNFVLAMAQYPTEAMHLIYSPTGTSKDLDDEHFSFFDGMFIGQPDGKVTILAVENDSHANSAGLKAGDEIVSIGGIPIQNDLNRFASAYTATKKAASDNEASSYPMMIRSAGASEAHAVNVPMPPSLKGGLMNGF